MTDHHDQSAGTVRYVACRDHLYLYAYLDGELLDIQTYIDPDDELDEYLFADYLVEAGLATPEQVEDRRDMKILPCWHQGEEQLADDVDWHRRPRFTWPDR